MRSGSRSRYPHKLCCTASRIQEQYFSLACGFSGLDFQLLSTFAVDSSHGCVSVYANRTRYVSVILTLMVYSIHVDAGPKSLNNYSTCNRSAVCVVWWLQARRLDRTRTVCTHTYLK